MTNTVKLYIKKLEETNNILLPFANLFGKEESDLHKLLDEIATLKQQIEAEEKTVSDEIGDLIFRYTLLLKYTSNSKKISDLLTDFMLRIK